MKSYPSKSIASILPWIFILTLLKKELKQELIIFQFIISVTIN